MENYDKFRTMIHPYLLKGMKMVKGKNHKIIGKMPVGNCLIVCNHECIDDVPAAGMTVKDHTYLLISDEDKNTLTGFGVTLNGAIWVNRHDKDNRRKSEQKVKEILAHGKNVMMYPEATWNLSNNDLMLNMNYYQIVIKKNSIIMIKIYMLKKQKTHIITMKEEQKYQKIIGMNKQINYIVKIKGQQIIKKKYQNMNLILYLHLNLMTMIFFKHLIA